MRQFLISILLVVPFFCASAQKPSSPNAAPSYGISFCNGRNMPDAYNFIPAYPKRGEAKWIVDSVYYFEGKALRDTPRGREAVLDARTSIQDYLNRISQVCGTQLTEAEYPQLCLLIRGTMGDVRQTIQRAKNSYARHRPYQVFNEPTPVPKDESPTDFTSYPSGHTVRAWALALLMTSVDPERADGYLKMGYEMGQSRVIVGFHYQSDVEAARLCASAAYARICVEKSFQKQLRKARKELMRTLN